ncbi:16S rRNA (guanine(966)-N(2))-methyltransferase [Geminocystis sp. NIES-3709]|nr:16S rRNA (guanine(966)-N(2))-methyltransferase [Geminocystis sp. NIES-3709]
MLVNLNAPNQLFIAIKIINFQLLISMRIYGNREIKTLSGKDTRPTTSKVREALFNIWRDEIESASWLDLCAGNGTMGAEALCRGVLEAVAIEKSSIACQIIRENWQKVATKDQKFKVLRGDILERLKSLKGEKFDLIYFDPPYHCDFYDRVLDIITDYQLLQGQIAVEYDPRKSKIKDQQKLQLIQTKFYGNIAINFYQN